MPGTKPARRPYYRWLAGPVTEAEYLEAHLTNALFNARRVDPEFGYRYLVEAHNAGAPMAEAELLEQPVVERIRQAQKQARPAGSRRSRRAQLRR